MNILKYFKRKFFQMMYVYCFSIKLCVKIHDFSIVMLKYHICSILVSYRMVIESQLPDGKMVPLNIPVSNCYYTGTMIDGSGSVAISQCNNDTVKCS